MTMTVREMAEWLSNYPDQDAIVQVVRHTESTSYYDQGGNCSIHDIDVDQDVEYLNFRGNQFVREDAPYYNRSYLFLGQSDKF